MNDSGIKPTDLIISNKLNDSAAAKVPDTVPDTLPATDVYSSYIFSTSNRKLSKYGERLLMEVISLAQEYTMDLALGIRKLEFKDKYSEKFAIVDIPVKNLLNSDDSTNYSRAKAAVMELMQIYHTVESPVLDSDGTQKTYKDGSPQYKFASYHLLDKVTINEKPGIVSVKLGEDTWSQILDMGKGYTRYNLLTAKTLDDVVAIRLFQLISNSSEPIRFTIDRLKGILGLQDKYVGNPNGFISRVIIPAEKEINEKCKFSVVHDLEYDILPKRGRPSIKTIILRKEQNKPDNNPHSVLSPDILNLLVKKYGFNERGIISNLNLFRQLNEKGIDIAGYLSSIDDFISRSEDHCAYIIKCLKGKVEDSFKEDKPLKGRKFIFTESNKSRPADSPKVEDKKPRKRLKVNGAEAFDVSDPGLEEF